MNVSLWVKRVLVGLCLVVFSVSAALILLFLRKPHAGHLFLKYEYNRTEGVVPKLEYIVGYAKFALKPRFFIHRTDREELAQEHVFRSDVNFYNYEEEMYVVGELFIEECYYFTAQKNDPFIIDCGGNIGLSTLYFKKYLYPQAKILVFEPDPCNFSVLQKNVELNKLTNVTICNKALSNKKGQSDFFVDRKGSTSAHLILKKNTHKVISLKDKISVECVLLSDYIDKPVDLLKLDVEGAEGLVLEDLEKNGKMKLIKEMFIEFHSRSPKTIGSILSILDANNFSYSIKQGQTLMAHAFNKKIVG